MLKKLFIAIMLLGILPGLANAWTITAKIGSGSGSLSCGAQTLTSGTAYFTIDNANSSATVNVQPNAGYYASLVTVDNVNVTQAGATSYTVNYAGANHTLTAYFSPVTYTVSLAQTSGGSVMAQRVLPTVGTISLTGLTGLAYGSTVEITATPNTGYAVTSISSTSTLGTVTHYSGQSAQPVKYRYLVERNATFTATYQVVPQVTARLNVNTNSTVTNTQVAMDASTSSSSNDPPLTFAWSVLQGDPSKVTFTEVSPGSTAAVYFQASAAGDYKVRVTAISAHGGTGTADSPVITVMTPGAYDSTSCNSCHVGRDPQVSSGYLSSPHAKGSISVSCSSCHNPGNTLSHPYDNQPIGSCSSCHTTFTAAGHDTLDSPTGCSKCHDPHSTVATSFIGVQVPHYNNVTSAAYPASYVSSRSVCADCHRTGTAFPLDAIRKSWAGSGHADVFSPGWRAEDFKTQNDCVRCHTRTGFVAYSSFKVVSAWGVASEKTKEVLNCNGCHNQDFSVRVMAPYSSASAFSFKVDAATTVSVPYKYLDYGRSNLCITCHAGTTSGEIIKLAFGFANFTAAGRLQNHFMVGAGVMDNNIGYEFDGTPGGRVIDFNRQNTWHSGIGLPNEKYDTGTSGPCVTCHMSAASNQHSFVTVFKNLTGSITQVAAAGICAKCHPSSLGGGEAMTAQAISNHKAGYSAALAALKGELKARGFDPDAPATITSWGGNPLSRSNNMGAFYNYLLLSRNDVAGYVHNPVYARRLIQYSIDWLDNQTFDDSCYTSINMLSIPQATKDAAVSYLGVTFSGLAPNCYSCHESYYN
ncbi:MAG TPA: hypothetical protein DCZ75_18060 [Geobacter sp.]|nr:hypothetical protein [Geobacter sp.]